MIFTTLCSPSFKVIELADSTKLLSASVTVTFISFFVLLTLSSTIIVAVPLLCATITISFSLVSDTEAVATVLLLLLTT